MERGNATKVNIAVCSLQAKFVAACGKVAARTLAR